MRLRILLGDHPGTLALKDGSLKSDLVSFDFAQYSPTNKGFKPMVREQAFDVAEMAIVTYLMARSFGKPMVLLPHVVVARHQYAHAVYRADLGNLKPRDLEGRRVGIRSFTTTTGAWLRGILANEHGVNLDAVRWVTFEDAHVAEYVDRTERAPAGKQIVQMLLDGELDAVLGEKVERPGLKPLFPDVAAEEESWFAKYGVLPINHMVVVSQQLADRHPDEVREVFRLLRESAARAPAAAVPQFSADEMRRSLEKIIGYAAQQQLIPRAFAVEELFDDLTEGLGTVG
ncbi:MAG: ABC transporter substrate-binding protein [Bradyrhizobium sp.]|uniref:ABC transporter substrate-binding protein n=1 Tax=Bradyrhizobium sp. TaxID=376 RepID=UPI002717910E|nr:ABC transporter substrate-binding protein [Bradyrhizobium sp.]MDO8398531.1 ABC transporter substrate-binding protein [Bradyrhizobium sp.]